MKLKEQVETILEKYPECRNSDIKLTLNVWHTFYNGMISEIGGEKYIKLKDLYDLPREDHIKRIRQKFNELGMYLPTNPDVQKKRKLLEKEWRKELGYV